jgi:CheY-like chemotaxis protein
MPFRYRILLVDNEPKLRQVGQAILESQGYEVLVAGDGFEALAALRQSLPDVIISDLNMPRMSGFEFLSVVRHRFPQIPVIVASGEFRGTEVPDGVLADAFFEKGYYTPTQLFTKIIDLLEELPSRPRPVRTSKAAVWVHRSGHHNYLVVTCNYCLRSFPVPPPPSPGIHEVHCNFCETLIRFQVTEWALARNAGNDADTV